VSHTDLATGREQVLAELSLGQKFLLTTHLGSVKYCGRRLAMRSKAFRAHAPAISGAAMICHIECTNGLSGPVAGGADRVEVAHAATVRPIERLRNNEVFVRNAIIMPPLLDRQRRSVLPRYVRGAD